MPSPPLSESDLQSLYAFAVELSHRAGKILMDGVEARCSGESPALHEAEKLNAVDIVTQTDLASLPLSTCIPLSLLPSFFPLTYELTSTSTHSFIGEETYSSGTSKQYLVTSSPTWIVDPLDGTVNYTHLFPMFCISIAFCLDGVPVVGVIYAPILDVTYSALKGHGAWENDDVLMQGSASGGKKKRKLPYVKGRPLGKDAPKGLGEG
ncbi:inositol monophosphatase protein [Rutstroemia sp. NJR-2017a BBW]|nr:inositol monophosphatase protein [Rutstroemia sp. NJR-2017a BBW]